MSSLKSYIVESYDELKNKVTWPSWSELQSSAIIVLISTLIIALVIYLMDLGGSNLLKQLYKIF